MAMATYAWLFLFQLNLVASLAPGGCTFVENGEDFSLVLKEDVNGETLSLTEDHPTSGDFKVKKFFVAKKHVSDAKKGTVLKKADFETSFVAPTFLTVFTGSATEPTPLCSINLAKGVGNKLPDDVKIIIQDIRALMSFGLGALLCCWARSRELKSRDHVDPLERIQLFAFMM